MSAGGALERYAKKRIYGLYAGKRRFILV